MVPRPRCPAIVPALSNWGGDTAAQAPTFTHAKQAVIHIFAHAQTQTQYVLQTNLQTSVATSTGLGLTQCECLATNDRSNAQRIRAYLPKRRTEADGLAHRPEVTNPRLFNVAKFERPCQRRTCHPYTCAHTCARAKVSLSLSLSRARAVSVSPLDSSWKHWRKLTDTGNGEGDGREQRSFNLAPVKNSLEQGTRNHGQGANESRFSRRDGLKTDRLPDITRGNKERAQYRGLDEFPLEILQKWREQRGGQREAQPRHHGRVQSIIEQTAKGEIGAI